MGLRNSRTGLEPPDLMDRLEPPDLREQVLLHEESANRGLGSGRSAPSIRLDSQLVFNGSDPDLWRRGPVEDATLLMVKTHGSTPPQIRIRAIEKLLHFDRI
uniref:Uncharacterized protein n=1 Tax=Fagus sylvatica TaxID=28930 RepID=A0A2N9IL57_FAGSY